MLSEEADLSRFSVLLLVLQAALSLSHVFARSSGDLQRIGSGVLLGTQACTTALMLVRRREETARIPALLCAFLLFGYAILLGVRGLFTLRGTAIDRTVLACAQVGLSMAMLAVLVGVAFGLFWMSTSVFANGLERIASTDPLTRIFNRRTFLLWCDKELQRSLASETSFSLLMLDLDHFKQVNDRFGHGIGDRLLCSVVERVQDGVRGIDVMGRWGGEEFVVLLPRATAEAAFLVAERVRRNIERSSIGLSEGEARGHPRLLRVTSSLGTATYGGATDTIAAMFERADAALYAAKQRGRNCTVTSGEGRLPQSPATSVPGIAEATPAPLLDPTAPSAPELVV